MEDSEQDSVYYTSAETLAGDGVLINGVKLVPLYREVLRRN